jgi:pentatricopeptide repeat protein
MRTFAVSKGHGGVVDGGPRRFDYKRRVLTTTDGGLVRKLRLFQQVGGQGDRDAEQRPPVLSGASKAQQRKLEKKNLRLLRQAESQEDPNRKEKAREISSQLVQCLKNKDFDTAVALYRNHRDVFTYRHNFIALLNVCYNYAHLETAKEIFGTMKEEHPGAPVEQAYLALIRCHTANDTPEDRIEENIVLAKGLVEVMTAQSIEPRLRTYQPILAALCRLGHLDAAIALVREMLDRGISPRAEQLGMLLTCAAHSGSLLTASSSSEGSMLRELLDVVGAISNGLLGIDMKQMHTIVAALRGETVEQSYARGVLVQDRKDIPGRIIYDNYGINKADDENGFAVGLSVYADHPLACYYGDRVSDNVTVTAAGTSSGARGPPPGNLRNLSAESVQYEYLTIGQRVTDLVNQVADKERDALLTALSGATADATADGVRLSIMNRITKWNEENCGKGSTHDRYSGGSGNGNGNGKEQWKKKGDLSSGSGDVQIYPSGGKDASAELPDIPLYKELYYTHPPQQPYSQRKGQGLGLGASACLVELSGLSSTGGNSNSAGPGVVCPHCQSELAKIALSEQQKHGVREALFGIANGTSKGQGSAIRAFGEWLDNKAEQGVQYSYIVDGANVAYHRQNFDGGKFSFRQVELVVDTLRKMMASDEIEKGNVLVLLPYPYAQKVVPNSSRHRRGRRIEYLSPQELAVLERFEKEKMLYVVPQGGNDDWFWMYATVHKLRTSRAYCITNDLMRDHRQAFAGESARIFERWRASTIIHFDFSRAVEEGYQCPRVMLTRPSTYSREIQVLTGGSSSSDAATNHDGEDACLDAIEQALDSPDDAILDACELFPDDDDDDEEEEEDNDAHGGGVYVHIPANDRSSYLCVGLPTSGGRVRGDTNTLRGALVSGIGLFDST